MSTNHELALEWFWSEVQNPDQAYWLNRFAQLPVVDERFRLKRHQSVTGHGPQEWCWVCASDNDLNWHHIIPVSCGGPTIEANLVNLCGRCHHAAHWSNTVAFDLSEIYAVVIPRKPFEMEPASPYGGVVLADIPLADAEAAAFFAAEQRRHDRYVTARFEASL